MLPPSLLLLLSTALTGVVAKPTKPFSRFLLPRQQDLSVAKQKVIIGGGGTGLITLAEFDGTKFQFLNNTKFPQGGGGASWLAFKEPNIIYSVNENSAELHQFKVDLTTNALDYGKNVSSSVGVVHLEFNKDKTRMVGSAFGNGTIDFWSLAPDGDMTLLKTIESRGSLGPNAAVQIKRRPHQAVVENSGRFFFVNDLGTDTIIIIDTKDDNFESVNEIKVQPGCGPRHGVMFPPGGDKTTHYLVVCELLNQVMVHKVNFSDEAKPTLQVTQLISTFDPQRPIDLNAVPGAGELAISGDNKSVYVSNRDINPQGSAEGAQDYISHFSIRQDDASGPLALSFNTSIDSGGKKPRMFSLSADSGQAVLFSTNQVNGTGLLAFSRCAETGSLAVVDGSQVPYRSFAPSPDFGPSDFGPQFVLGLAPTVVQA